MNEHQKQRANELSKLIWRHHLASFRGRKLLKLFLLIGVTGLILLYFLWPAIRPAREFVGFERAIIQSETIYQPYFHPPKIRLLVQTSNGALTTLSTRASYAEITDNTVCVRKYETAKGAISYDIALPIKCTGI